MAVSPQAVNQWVSRAEEKGREAHRAVPRSGRPHDGPPPQQDILPSILVRGALAYGYTSDLWTLPRIVDVVEKEWGVRYSRNRMWELLKAHGLSWQKPHRQAREKNLDAVRPRKRSSRPRYKKKPDTRERS